MTKDEALKLAMDWYGSGNQDPDEFERLILSIVAQPEQEPVGVVGTDLGGTHLMYGSQYVGKTPDKKTAIFFKDVPIGAPLYTTPPQRKPLTDEEADEFVRRFARYELIRAIEAAHGIKE